MGSNFPDKELSGLESDGIRYARNQCRAAWPTAGARAFFSNPAIGPPLVDSGSLDQEPMTRHAEGKSSVACRNKSSAVPAARLCRSDGMGTPSTIIPKLIGIVRFV